MPNKYHNKKTDIGNITFDSRKEATRYLELKMLERAGKIQGLALQPRFELIPKQRGEKAVTYTADFSYLDAGRLIVEDVKSPITLKNQAYIIKRKLFKQKYPDIDFREV